MIAALLALLAAGASPPPLRCGAVERPGIAERGADGVWRGVAMTLCRQVARGSSIPIVFHPYRTIADLRDAGHDELAVLSGAELAIALPANSAALGPPIAFSRQLLLVPNDTPLRSPFQLAGHRVCFLIASAAQAALNTWANAANITIRRAGFQEPVELRDAFDAKYCAAMAVDAQYIPGGAEHIRELGPPLAEVPLFAIRLGKTAR